MHPRVPFPFCAFVKPHRFTRWRRRANTIKVGGCHYEDFTKEDFRLVPDLHWVVKREVNDRDGHYTELRRAYPRYLFYEGIYPPARAFTPCEGKCFTTNEGLLREGKAECEWDRRERKKKIAPRVNECEWVKIIVAPSDISVTVNLAHDAIRRTKFIYISICAYMPEHNCDSRSLCNTVCSLVMSSTRKVLSARFRELQPAGSSIFVAALRRMEYDIVRCETITSYRIININF